MYINSLKPKDKMYQLREGHGFGIRILPSGHKVWIFTYTFDGRRRQMNLGTYCEAPENEKTKTTVIVSLADARAAYNTANAIFLDKQNPRDPQSERDLQDTTSRQERDEHRLSFTVAELVDEYITKHAMTKKRTWKEDERILAKDVLPLWKDIKAKDINRRDVTSLLDGMQGRGNGIITNTFKIVRRMFGYAVKKEIVSVSPCYGFEKGDELPNVSSRERSLSEDEIKTFWVDLEKTAMSIDTRRALKLILLTGQRPGEVASMHRKEIRGRWWEFTPKETVITKEIPRKQRAFLTDKALELIGIFDDGGYVFKGKKDDTRHITERSISQALRKNLLGYEPKKKVIIKKAKTATVLKRKKPFVVPDVKKMDIEHFTPHDLRRTCSTLISELGFTDAVVDAILAHLKKGEIRTYNKNKYDKEKQAAIEEWELKLNSIITGTEYVDKASADKRKHQEDLERLREENEELKLRLNTLETEPVNPSSSRPVPLTV